MDLGYFYTCNDEKADYDKDDYIRKYKERINYALDRKLSDYYYYGWYEEIPEHIGVAIETYEVFFSDIKSCSAIELDCFIDNDNTQEVLDSFKFKIEELTRISGLLEESVEKTVENNGRKSFIDATKSLKEFFDMCLYHYKKLYNVITNYIDYEKFCREYLEKSEYSYTEEEVNTILNEVITDYNNKVDNENSTLGEIKSLKEKIVSLKNYRKVLLRDNGDIY